MLEILQGKSEAIEEAIQADQIEKQKKMQKAINYYEYQHDIEDNRIFYFDEHGVLQEDQYATNTKISHPFFTELVDQSVSYLLSNPVEVTTEDPKFKEYLEEYWGEDMQLFLQEMVEGSSIKSYEYAFVRTTNEDKITFQVSNSKQTFDVVDHTGDRVATVRYYELPMLVDDRREMIEHCEVWTDYDVRFYRKNEKQKWILNPDESPNPRSHVVATQVEDDDKEPTVFGRSYGQIPFYKLKNNKQMLSDLKPVKSLIDDYDIMACYLSNNLQDFTEALYVVKGYKGNNLQELEKAIKGRKLVKTGDGGDIDIKTVEIPVEGRKTKLSIDKEAIYKFGMGFDATQLSDNTGNITNVQIMAGYSLLDMKTNKKEKYLRMMIRWMNDMIVSDINRRHGTNYNADDIEVTITRETTVNQQELAEIARTEAETKTVLINGILSVSSILDDETVLREICEIYELDFDEVQERIVLQDYQIPGIREGTDPDEIEGAADGGQPTE